MKISKVIIKNLYGIKEFSSDGGSLELDGKNGVGKSAVIDAIKYALTNRSDREYLIRAGETEGEVFIELTNGTSIHRKSRTNKADYKSIKTAGDKTEKNESFLRTIFTELQLDPIKFSEMTPAEQNRIILDLIDFKWDLNWIQEQFGEIPQGVNYEQNILRVLHEIQSDKGFYFTKREDINRERRNKQAFIEEIAATLPTNYNAKEWDAVNLGDLYTQIENIRTENGVIENAKAIVAGHQDKVQQLFDLKLRMREKYIADEKQAVSNQQLIISDLKHKIELAEQKIAEAKRTTQNLCDMEEKLYQNNLSLMEEALKEHSVVALKTVLDFSDLQAEAQHAETMKAHINEYNRMIDLQGDVARLAEESNELTEKIEKARQLPGEILATCKIPIADLTIKDGAPLIKGLPISNLSDGEKMDLCVDVTVAKEGNLKLILIDGMERLATDRRDEMYTKLAAKGVQFIASRTTDDNELTVVQLPGVKQ